MTIQNIVLVLSGKGGVGKSTVSAELALTLSAHPFNKRVGILDVDLTGPSMPRILGLQGKQVHQGSAGWVPVFADDRTRRLSCMSIGFLLKNPDDAVVWRGPKKNAMIKQFIEDVAWGDLDYLIIDTPPGTGDEHISLGEHLRDLKPNGAVIVTTPQNVAIADVRKELSFCRKVSFPVIGIVENMSGYVCPHCAECTNIFSKGGGEALAREHGVPFLGCIPIDPSLVSLIESGNENGGGGEVRVGDAAADGGRTDGLKQGRRRFCDVFGESALAPLFRDMAEKVRKSCEGTVE
ncbi:nucleotide-binding protein 2 [Zopfochytrium polystomum]|nr:nucleotide-binding protein 2 [Zopfochytrium polystomum]